MRGSVLAGSLSFALIATGCTQGAQSPSTSKVSVPSDAECIGNYLQNPDPTELRTTRLREQAALTLASSVRLSTLGPVVNFIENQTTTDGVSDQKTEVLSVKQDVPYKCDFLDFLSHAAVFGVYNRDADALVLVDTGEPVSQTWGGLIFLHESRHGLNRKTTKESPNEERDTRIFEQEIVNKVGGAAYKKLLETMMAEATRDTFNPEHSFSLKPEVLQKHDAELDKIFGRPLSDTDKRIRTATIFIQLGFELIAKKAQQDGVDIAASQQAFILALQQNENLN